MYLAFLYCICLWQSIMATDIYWKWGGRTSPKAVVPVINIVDWLVFDADAQVDGRELS